MAGGIVCRSIVGVGKSLSKTKTQLQSLSGRRSSIIAGATGASIKEDRSPEARSGIQSDSEGAASYGINFIQHSPEPLAPVNKCPVAEYPHLDRQPKAGFAVKKGGGKRVLFTVAQKEVMIEFYERQVTQGIRANPKDALEVMQQRGIEPLKETQIRSWWSTYHQKRKAALNTLTEEANTLASRRPCAATSLSMASPVPLQQLSTTSQGNLVLVTPSSSVKCTSYSPSNLKSLQAKEQ